MGKGLMHKANRFWFHVSQSFRPAGGVVDCFKVGVVLTNGLIIASIWATRYL